MKTFNQFNTTNLGSIAKIQTGPFGSQLHERDYVEKGTPIITVEHLGYGKIIKNNIPFVSESDTLRLKKFLLKPDDIVFSRVGSVDRSVLIRKEEDGWMFSGRCLRVRITTKDVLPTYLYYYFTQDSFRQYVRNNAVGATMPSLNSSILRRLRILYPSLPKQKQINDILSAIDDSLTNNHTRTQLLEESARLLFREWFVYFRFPGHEKVKIVDGVPEGWERKPISALTSFLSRGVAPHYDEDADGLVINQKCIRGGRLDVSLARRQSREFKPDRQVQPGDVLINSTGEGTLGRVAQVLAPIASCTVDTHVTIARPIPQIGVHYFGQSLMAWEPRLSTMGRGATNQTELSRGQIGEIDILVPSHSLVQLFEEYSEPIFSQVSTLLEQNQKLKVARDLLLPRLMSGAIEV